VERQASVVELVLGIAGGMENSSGRHFGQISDRSHLSWV
jgi:hypothetical protein